MSRLFDSYAVKGLTLKNRIVMLPMCMYMASSEGKVTPWHLVHYGARAVGGCGLLIQEATAVEKRGRLSENDLGIWSDEQVEGLRLLVDTVHTAGGKAAIQLAHGGRKAWVGESTVAPSPLPFALDDKVPQDLTKDEAEQVVESFRLGSRRAVAAGYDAVEIHGAHGYLIHQFLSPHSNKRTDSYGGSLEKMRLFPLQVIKAVKDELPEHMPLMMRISAVEYLEDGYTFDEMVSAVQIFCQAGVDLVDVSTGGAAPHPVAVWPGYQIPYAEHLRKQLKVPVLGCGLIRTGAMADETIANGRIDLIGIGRGILSDPHWALTAARELQIAGQIPVPYRGAYPAGLSS